MLLRETCRPSRNNEGFARAVAARCTALQKEQLHHRAEVRQSKTSAAIKPSSCRRRRAEPHGTAVRVRGKAWEGVYSRPPTTPQDRRESFVLPLNLLQGVSPPVRRTDLTWEQSPPPHGRKARRRGHPPRDAPPCRKSNRITARKRGKAKRVRQLNPPPCVGGERTRTAQPCGDFLFPCEKERTVLRPPRVFSCPHAEPCGERTVRRVTEGVFCRLLCVFFHPPHLPARGVDFFVPQLPRAFLPSCETKTRQVVSQKVAKL